LSEKAGRMFIIVVITNCHNKPDVLWLDVLFCFYSLLEFKVISSLCNWLYVWYGICGWTTGSWNAVVWPLWILLSCRVGQQPHVCVCNIPLCNFLSFYWVLETHLSFDETSGEFVAVWYFLK
jgi:hypothetical protein